MVVAATSAARADAPVTLDRPSTEPPVPRLRIGLDLGGGVAYGATTGGVLGAYGHVGAQITRELGVFYMPSLLGYGLGNGQGVSPFLVSSHSAMVDLTLRSVAQVGVGGGLDFGTFAWCDEATTLCYATGREVHPSMTLRAAFLVAFARQRARWAIPIGLQAHIMMWDHRPQNHLVVTVGFSRY